jgi:hypothetical protein
MIAANVWRWLSSSQMKTSLLSSSQMIAANVIEIVIFQQDGNRNFIMHPDDKIIVFIRLDSTPNILGDVTSQSPSV